MIAERRFARVTEQLCDSCSQFVPSSLPSFGPRPHKAAQLQHECQPSCPRHMFLSCADVERSQATCTAAANRCSRNSQPAPPTQDRKEPLCPADEWRRPRRRQHRIQAGAAARFGEPEDLNRVNPASPADRLYPGDAAFFDPGAPVSGVFFCAVSQALQCMVPGRQVPFRRVTILAGNNSRA